MLGPFSVMFPYILRRALKCYPTFFRWLRETRVVVWVCGCARVCVCVCEYEPIQAWRKLPNLESVTSSQLTFAKPPVIPKPPKPPDLAAGGAAGFGALTYSVSSCRYSGCKWEAKKHALYRGGIGFVVVV